jgi:hypothetical protein
VTAVDPISARFAELPDKAGHYESFYLKLCHPSEPLGAWIRYTVHKRPGAPATGSLWFTLFEPEGPRAAKLTVAAPRSQGDDWISMGEARLGAGEAAGSIAGEVEWELRFEGGEEPLFHLPRAWLYSARLPRTKLLSPLPAARFDGRLSVDGRERPVEGWRGMVGHNWGAQPRQDRPAHDPVDRRRRPEPSRRASPARWPRAPPGGRRVAGQLRLPALRKGSARARLCVGPA